MSKAIASLVIVWAAVYPPMAMLCALTALAAWAQLRKGRDETRRTAPEAPLPLRIMRVQYREGQSE